MAKQIKWPKWLDYYEEHTQKAPKTAHTLKSKNGIKARALIKKWHKKVVTALENASK